MGDMTITKESATIEAINQFGQVRRTMTIKPKEGWWQKQQRGKEETVAEIEVEVQNIATVGSVLNSNTIVQINVALARSSVLSQFGALPLWVCLLVPIICLGVLVMGAIAFSSMKVGKRGGLTYTRSVPVVDDSASDREVELSSSDAEKLSLPSFS